MAAFRLGLRRELPHEAQDAAQSKPAEGGQGPMEDVTLEIESGSGQSDGEVPERASLRDLDEEIRRRDGELRSSKEAERASPAAIGSRQTSGRTKAADSGSAVTVEDAREDIFKLAGRLEALESSVRETQRRDWDALHEQQEQLGEHLGGLEQGVDVAMAEATKAEARAVARLEKLAARVEALENLPERIEAVERLSERIEALDEQLGAARDESRRSVEEARSAQRPLKKRLDGLETGLEEAVAKATKAEARAEAVDEQLAAARDESRRSVEEASDAVEQRFAGLKEAADEALAEATETEARAGARLEKLAARVEALEMEAASSSRKLEQRAAETIESLAARSELAEAMGRLSARVAALDRRLSETETQSRASGGVGSPT